MFSPKTQHTTKPTSSKSRGGENFIQPKLNLGKPGDKYEVEADKAADQIVVGRKESPNSFFAPTIQKKNEEEFQKQESNEQEIQQKPLVDSISPVVQLKSENSLQKQEEELQKQEEEEIQEKEEEKNQQLQMSGGDENSSLESNLSNSKGRGSSLSSNTKSEMESGFGADFSGVRVHNDSNAVQMNKELGSQAFTNGNDIYFNEGKYNPTSESGKHLLAHELTHTLQQNTNTPSIQKFESDEHKELGDSTGMTISMGSGIELSFGDVVALAGDEYGSLEELQSAMATEEGRQGLRAHIEHAGIDTSATALLPMPTDEVRASALEQYVRLASDNTSHFFEGGTALSNWAEHHQLAIDLAIQAGVDNNEQLMNQALLAEAFGAHFLTDSFSSGHIRTPRQEITTYYTTVFAPAVYDHIVNTLTQRFENEIYAQVARQSWQARTFEGTARDRIRTALNERLTTAVTAAGGRAQVIQMMGLAFAGIIAGSMHDMENRDGLMVVSDVHPDPWRAYGDAQLDTNPEHLAVIESAVASSLNDVIIARELGMQEANLIPLDVLPEAIYFSFDSSAISSAAETSLNLISQYLYNNPETRVQVIGHTDTLGTDSYNLGLSELRAHSAAYRLISFGVSPERIDINWMGETVPVSSRNRLNRRVNFYYTSNPSEVSGGSLAFESARERAGIEIGPPYQVEQHLPRLATGMNNPIPDWHWEALPANFRVEINSWVVHYLTEFRDQVVNNPQLDSFDHEGNTIEPRPIVEGIMDEILNDPVSFLNNLTGSSQTTP